MDNDILTNLENECLDQNVIWQASPTKISFFISLALLVQPDTRRLNVNLSTTPMYQSIISGDYNPVSVQESSIDKSVKADDAAVPPDLLVPPRLDRCAERAVRLRHRKAYR